MSIDPITRASAEPMWRILLIASTLAVSWLGTQIVHEFGHVAAAWLTGGTVVHVELKPWTLSRTDVAPNPRPLVVAWSGALVGVALPLLAWWMARVRRAPSVYLWRFFAGFCLIANGVYLGTGSITRSGDPADILRLHAPIWSLLAFALLTVPSGFVLWHGLGPHFGIGPAAQPVSRRHGVACTALLFAIVAVEAAV